MMHTRQHTRPTRTVRVRLTRLGAAQRIALVLPTLAVLGALGASHASADGTPDPRLMPCAQEDSTGCVWDARHMGNGDGRSFLVTPTGKLIPLPHYAAHALVNQ